MKDVIAIVRMMDGTQFDFSNSSIVLGDGNPDSTNIITEIGAIFFMDSYQGTNTLFQLNNVVLGGLALWGLTDFNPNRHVLQYDAAPSFFTPAFNDNDFDRTVVNAGQNAQVCAQFISNRVLMSDARWNRCSTGYSEPSGQIPVNGALALLGSI